jgi:hypothetical protein
MSTVDLIAGTNPEPFSTSKTSNWVARVGGLPTLIQHVAHDLMPGAGTVSHAIEMAVGIVHNWAHGHDGKGNRVSPAVMAEAVKAIAEWDAKRARAHALATTPREHAAVDLCFALPTQPKKSRASKLIQLARYFIFGPPIDLAPSTMERRRAAAKGQALPGKDGGAPRFPIRNASDLDKAIKAVGRARPNTEEERRKVRRFIRRRAQALGLTSRLPDNWKADGSLAS